MRKFFAVFGALVFLVGLSYSKVGKINISGKIEVQGRSLNNSTDLANYDPDKAAATDDKIGDVRTRVLLGLDAKITEGVRGVVLLSKRDRLYGQPLQSVLGLQNSVNIENAYLVLDDFLNIFKITLGRQFLGEEGDLNLYYGPTRGDLLGITSVDGLKADTRIGKFDVSLLSFKLTESLATPSADIDLSGITVSCGGRVIEGLKTKVYAYHKVDKSVGITGQFSRDDLRVYGLKGTYEIKRVEGLKVNAEYSFNAGKNNNTNVSYEGSAYILGANYDGLKFKDMPLSFGLEYASGSGNDNTTAAKQESFMSISSDKRYGTIWSDSLGMVGLTNLTVLKLSAEIKNLLDERLQASLNYYNYTATKVAAGSNDDWGNEINLKLNWKQSKDVSLELILAQLSPGKALQNILGVTTDDSITKILTNLKVSF